MDATMVVSQNSTMLQLIEQVSQTKMENEQILEQFDCLAAQMEAFMNTQTTTPD